MTLAQLLKVIETQHLSTRLGGNARLSLEVIHRAARLYIHGLNIPPTDPRS
jgi:hypothetical protein